MLLLKWIVCQCCVGSTAELLCDPLFKQAGNTHITSFIRCYFFCILLIELQTPCQNPRGEVYSVRCVYYSNNNKKKKRSKNKRILWVQSFRGSCQTSPFFSNPVFGIILHCYGMLFHTQPDTHTMCCQSLACNFIRSLFTHVTNMPTCRMAVYVNCLWLFVPPVQMSSLTGQSKLMLNKYINAVICYLCPCGGATLKRDDTANIFKTGPMLRNSLPKNVNDDERPKTTEAWASSCCCQLCSHPLP